MSLQFESCAQLASHQGAWKGIPLGPWGMPSGPPPCARPAAAAPGCLAQSRIQTATLRAAGGWDSLRLGMPAACRHRAQHTMHQTMVEDKAHCDLPEAWPEVGLTCLQSGLHCGHKGAQGAHLPKTPICCPCRVCAASVKSAAVTAPYSARRGSGTRVGRQGS